MAAVNVTFPGNLAQVKTAADLRSVPSTLLPLGALFLVNGLEGLFEYDPGSLAADDGKDVLRPADKTPGQTGRWIRNVDGLAAGPEGPSGPANSTFTSRRNLEMAPVSNRSYNFAPDADDTSGWPAGAYFFTPGDFSGARYAADFVSGLKVKLDTVALTTGALVRQGAQSVVYGSSTVDDGILQLGVTVDRIGSVESAISRVQATGAPLVAKSSLVPSAYNIKTLNTAIEGVAGVTRLTASGSPSLLIDAEAPSEVSYYPFRVSNMDLYGPGITDAAVGIQWRRNYVFENSFIAFAPVGVRVKDGNSGIFRNIRTAEVGIGFHSIGSNHQSTHDSCTFSGAKDVGLKVEAKGTGADGNHALTFLGCLSQDNVRCIESNDGTSMDWFGGYIGEASTSYVIDNKGGKFTMYGGIAFFDHSAGNFLVRPSGSGAVGHGGVTHFKDTLIAASGLNGLSKLSYLDPSEVDIAKNGKIIFENCDIFCPLSGGGLLMGDVIGQLGTSRSLVKRNGSSWQEVTSGGTSFSVTTNGSAKTITGTAGTPPTIIGFVSPLLSTDYRLDGPMFFIMCYQSTKDLIIRTGTSALAGGGALIGTAPATGAIANNGWKTRVLAEAVPNALSSGVLEIFVNGGATTGDAVSILRVGLADADFVNSGGKTGALSNLYYP